MDGVILIGGIKVTDFRQINASLNKGVMNSCDYYYISLPVKCVRFLNVFSLKFQILNTNNTVLTNRID